MRRLKKKLGDGEVYTFTTLSRLDVTNYAAIFADKEARQLQSFQARLDGGKDLTEEEYENFLGLQKSRMKKLNQLIRISLGHTHPQFKLNADPDQDDAANTELEKIIDIRDTAQILEFITTGTITQQKETFIKEEDIEL